MVAIKGKGQGTGSTDETIQFAERLQQGRMGVVHDTVPMVVGVDPDKSLPSTTTPKPGTGTNTGTDTTSPSNDPSTAGDDPRTAGDDTDGNAWPQDRTGNGIVGHSSGKVVSQRRPDSKVPTR